MKLVPCCRMPTHEIALAVPLKQACCTNYTNIAVAVLALILV